MAQFCFSSPLGEGGRRSRSDEGESQFQGFALIRHASRITHSPTGEGGTLHTFTPVRFPAGGIPSVQKRTGVPVTRRVLRVVMRIVENGAERSPTETPAIRAMSAPGPCLLHRCTRRSG